MLFYVSENCESISNIGKCMKKRRLIVINLIMFLFIFLFVMLYARQHRENFIAEQKKSFEDMTIAVEQITENYLLNEQRICDVWAEYIRREKMTMEEAVAFLEKSSVLDETSCQLLYMDGEYPYGFATAQNPTTGDNRVSYQNIKIIKDEDQVSEIEGGINITRAFTDPVLGVQSLAFYDKLAIQEGSRVRDCLLLRILPISDLQTKWMFETVKFETAEFAIADKGGNYIIKGAPFKNNNFFEFYASYNKKNSVTKTKLKERMAVGAGTFEMKDSKNIPVLVAYTPVQNTIDWKIIAGVQMREIVENKLNWGLLGFVAAALIALFLYDLTAIQVINRRLANAAKAADQASRAKTDFLSSMSHDIRTPMNAIVGMTAIARSNVNDPERVSDCLDKISLANNHLLTLVNDILDISKIESGKLALVERPFSLHELLENTANVSKPQLVKKNIHFTFDKETQTDQLIGDELRLNQVFINLLSNAIKYTEPGGDVRVKIREEDSPRGSDFVRLIWSVEDTGMGMSEDFMKTMYSTFTRAEDTRVNKVQGTGLGLTIVKQLVDLMGGSIACESEVNKGTTFTVTLDLQRGSEESAVAGKQAENAEEDRVSVAGMKVLVAEDIAVNWEIVSVMLSQFGITAEHAWNGVECVEMVKSRRGDWDLILMDIQMPRMNGLEATRQIRALADPKQAGIPIIAMTADAFSENVRQCLDVGMNGHISKPIDMKIVLREIRKVKEGQL